MTTATNDDDDDEMPVIRRIRRESYPDQDQEINEAANRSTERESDRGVRQRGKQQSTGDDNVDDGVNNNTNNMDNEDGEGVHHRDLLDDGGISTEDAFVGYTADRAVSINVRTSLHFLSRPFPDL